MAGGDSIGAKHSKFLNDLESRYTCLHHPLPPGAGGRTDRSYLTSLRVYGNLDDVDDKPLPTIIGELPFSWPLESPPETRNQRQLFENERKPEHVASFKNQSHVHYVEHVDDNMKNESANSTSVGTEHSIVHCFEAGNEDFDTIKGKKRENNNKSSSPIKKRKITVQSAGLENIRKHYRKTNHKRADISPVSRSGNHDLAASVHQPDIQPEITSTEQFIESKVKNLTIKATYKDNMVKFPLRPSDGLVKLKELIVERFPLESFKLKYKDEDGDMIWISCDDSLMETIAEFTQPDGQTLIRLFVLPDGQTRL